MAFPPSEWTPVLAVFSFLAGAGLSFAAGPVRGPVLSSWASAAALCFAALAAVALASGPSSALAPAGSLFRYDALSAVILTLIAFVGLIVVRFSINYLGGNSRRREFSFWISLTLACVSALVIADDIRLFVGAWIATSLSLHQLLLFYRDRPRAIIAARKKFLFARIGDAALIIAAIALVQTFNTASIGEMLAAAAAMKNGGPLPAALAAVPFLLTIAAVLKCAQVPAHGWLVEVMETPTPVSALLHAGIVNAGGFLIIRFADVMVLSAPAMHALAVIGVASALLGSIIMLTQSSIKASLAYSTVAQMGFMLLQCGLGAFAPAALHIVTHSLYKAHAFLSSGRAVMLARIPRPALSPRKRDAAIALAASVAIYLAVAALFGGDAGEAPAVVALGAIFVVGLAMYLSATLTTPAGRLAGVGLALGAATLYFALQNAAARLLAGVTPPYPALDLVDAAVIAFVLVSFAAIALFQIFRPASTFDLGRRFYVHAANGFYSNAFLDRAIGALRVRPAN